MSEFSTSPDGYTLSCRGGECPSLDDFCGLSSFFALHGNGILFFLPDWNVLALTLPYLGAAPGVQIRLTQSKRSFS